MDLLRIYTLGGLRLLRGDEPVARFETRKAEAFLVYLACNRRAYPREVLADLLWDERSQEQALSNLRVVLVSLKKGLGEYLSITRESVALNPQAPVWIDAGELEARLEASRKRSEVATAEDAGQIEQAINLYSGEFLEGFYVRASQGFDDWLVRERERLHRLVVDGMHALVSYELQSGDYPAGLGQASRLLGLDPLDELGHRQMMQLLVYSGKRSEALAQYAACRNLLRDELGIEPSAATQALYEQIRSGELARTRPPQRGVRGYQLGEQIGSGSYGAVYRAHQPAVGREVAVKVILPQYANEAEFIRRFEAEAQIVARLEHPHIVPLYDYWREPDGAYLVMRLLKGGSLETLLERGPVEGKRAVELVEQVASGLALAHRQWVVHRDIKPANILLDEAGNAYLTDFGIAKVLGGKGQQTQAGAIFGTPSHISPEQILGQAVTAQSDIYSLGIVLYEMLTGRAPFPDKDLGSLIDKHLHKPVPSVCEGHPDLPEAVDQVIQRATAKDPADRYPDALALAEAFRQAVGGSLGRAAVVVAPGVEVVNPYKGLSAFQVGQHNAALKQYQSFEQLLRKELGLDPQPETRALYKQIRKGEFKRVPVGIQRETITPQNNLPQQVTSFIGRETQQAEIMHLFDSNRLITLTGPGGTGKTRLALQTGAELVEAYEHGVWFVEFAPLSDGNLVPQALASALELLEEPGTPLLESLVKFVRDRQLLVILDNCEHMLQACAELAVQLLKAAPRLKILATSRERLHVAGEAAYPLSPLSIPDPAQTISLESLTLSEAVRMFIDRATAVQPAFQVNNHNAPAVAEICFRLEGIPLAIELAAARVRSLPVEKIAERIGDRFRLLTGGDRTSLPRHQTLRALIDWSHDLLSEPEQVLLRRLSVFAGGWTLEAAEAACAGGSLDALDVLDLLGNLVEKSLVGLHPETGSYTMLETVRQYAHEKLESAAETVAFRHQHYRYYLSQAETPNPYFTGSDHAAWIERMEDEADNLRAAIQWALESGKADEALHLCFTLRSFWRAGYFSEGFAWLERALAQRQEASQQALAEGLVMAGELAYDTGEIGVMDRYMSECLSIARAEGYNNLTAIALMFLGAGLYGKVDADQAHSMLVEALSIEQKLGDKGMMSIVLLLLGVQSEQGDDFPQAQRFYEQSLALSRAAGEMWCMSSSLGNLGVILYNQGDLETAQRMFEQALAIKRPLRGMVHTAVVLGNLGLIAIQKNETERARELEVETLIIRRQIGNLIYMAVSFSGIASVLRLEGQPVKAAQLQGFVTAILEQKGSEFDLMEQTDYDNTAEGLKAILGEDGYQQAIEAGKALTLEQAVGLALNSSLLDGKPD